MEYKNGESMKLKNILVSMILMSAVFALQNIQTMAGARVFAKKLFLSKTAALAAVCAATPAYFADELQEVVGSFLALQHTTTLSRSAQKELQEHFRKNGFEIEVKDMEMLNKEVASQLPIAMAVIQTGANKGFLYLASGARTAFETGKFYSEGGVQFSKREGELALYHEQSHLQHLDYREIWAFLGLKMASFLMGIKSAQVAGRGKLVSLGGGLIGWGLMNSMSAQRRQAVEKRCDLAVPTSDEALIYSRCCGKANALLKEQGNSDSSLWQRLFGMHPPFGERQKYTEEHAQILKKQGK